jgi:hypothetical protein
MKKHKHKRIELRGDTVRVLSGHSLQAVVGGLTTQYTSRDSQCVSICPDMSDC